MVRMQNFEIQGLVEGAAEKIEILTIQPDQFDDWLLSQSDDHLVNYIKFHGFCASSGTYLLYSNQSKKICLFGVDQDCDSWLWSKLANELSQNMFLEIDQQTTLRNFDAVCWALASYEYKLVKKRSNNERAKLIWPATVDRENVKYIYHAIFLTRDLINTPASHMGPAELAEAAKKLANEHGAEFNTIVGDGLLKNNYPAIHAVGRASAVGREPRLIDFSWGDESDPKLTLVGKGVCFDTGGLDLKPSSNMKLMKKDMGGAAAVLGLASLIMSSNLPVRLRVLIPAVENSVSADALRPGDVVETRSGKTIEICNTDAEGRVILADALFEADREEPDLIIDCATLTGAARVALGADVPALFSSDDRFADLVVMAGEEEQDPLWRLPLFNGYRKQIKGKVADLTNAPEGGYGGAITAALFLQEFVSDDRNWAHIDMMAWNLTSRPGRPEGGEAQGIRALFRAIQDYFDL